MSRFRESDSVFRLASLPSSGGIDPDSSFESRESVSRLASSPSSGGMGPANPLPTFCRPVPKLSGAPIGTSVTRPALCSRPASVRVAHESQCRLSPPCADPDQPMSLPLRALDSGGLEGR